MMDDDKTVTGYIPLGIRGMANNIEFVKMVKEDSSKMSFKEQLRSITYSKPSKVEELKKDLLEHAKEHTLIELDLADYSLDCYQWLLNEGFVVEEVDGYSHLSKTFTYPVRIRWDR